MCAVTRDSHLAALHVDDAVLEVVGAVVDAESLTQRLVAMATDGSNVSDCGGIFSQVKVFLMHGQDTMRVQWVYQTVLSISVSKHSHEAL